MIFVILLHCYDSPLSSTIVQSTKHDTDMGHGDANTIFQILENLLDTIFFLFILHISYEFIYYFHPIRIFFPFNIDF